VPQNRENRSRRYKAVRKHKNNRPKCLGSVHALDHFGDHFGPHQSLGRLVPRFCDRNGCDPLLNVIVIILASEKSVETNAESGRWPIVN